MTTSTRTDLLVVEDDPGLQRALVRSLDGPEHEVVHAVGSAGEARELMTDPSHAVGVAFVDVGLPDGDGLDLVEALRRDDPFLGVVIATGADDRTTAERAIALGLQGYLLKPFALTEALINVANARHWRALQRAREAHRDQLERLVLDRTAELDRSRFETVHRLARAAEHRDPETGYHLERMSEYSAVLGRRAGLGPEEVERLRAASPMHDIGKIAIRDEILNHRGVFDAAQRAEMARHTVLGHEILAGSESPLLETAATIALSHHEWWDGSGHPEGLAGERIPLVARIVAIADVFDALTSARRYKPAFDFVDASVIMRDERGTHFDPRPLDLFLDGLGEQVAIRRRFSDAVTTVDTSTEALVG